MIEAARLAIEDFEREYESDACAVCKAEKWPDSPFCRKCSIRLQRAHLMSKFDALIQRVRYEIVCPASAERKWNTWTPDILCEFWRHYDTCRDYLITKKREGRTQQAADDF